MQKTKTFTAVCAIAGFVLIGSAMSLPQDAVLDPVTLGNCVLDIRTNQSPVTSVFYTEYTEYPAGSKKPSVAGAQFKIQVTEDDVVEIGDADANDGSQVKLKANHTYHVRVYWTVADAMAYYQIKTDGGDWSSPTENGHWGQQDTLGQFDAPKIEQVESRTANLKRVRISIHHYGIKTGFTITDVAVNN